MNSHGTTMEVLALMAEFDEKIMTICDSSTTADMTTDVVPEWMKTSKPPKMTSDITSALSSWMTGLNSQTTLPTIDDTSWNVQTTLPTIDDTSWNFQTTLPTIDDMSSLSSSSSCNALTTLYTSDNITLPTSDDMSCNAGTTLPTRDDTNALRINETLSWMNVPMFPEIQEWLSQSPFTKSADMILQCILCQNAEFIPPKALGELKQYLQEVKGYKKSATKLPAVLLEQKAFLGRTHEGLRKFLLRTIGMPRKKSRMVHAAALAEWLRQQRN